VCEACVCEACLCEACLCEACVGNRRLSLAVMYSCLFPPFRPFCQSVCLSHITVYLRVRFRNMEYVLCNIFDGIRNCPIPKIESRCCLHRKS